MRITAENSAQTYWRDMDNKASHMMLEGSVIIAIFKKVIILEKLNAYKDQIDDF